MAKSSTDTQTYIQTHTHTHISLATPSLTARPSQSQIKSNQINLFQKRQTRK